MATTDGSTTKVLSPSKLAHIVIRTSNLPKMAEYYKKFLGAHAVYENEMLAFLTYDEEHHRIALLNIPGLEKNDGKHCGLEHIAFTFDTLQDLCLAYKQRKALGITPGWCVNHGPTTSMYYRDPDGNQIETQVDDFETPEEATTWMMSPEFAANQLGADFDPEELCKRIEAGEDEKIIKARKNVGPSGLEAIAGIREKMEGSLIGV